jgi:hypothetical protein
MMAQKMARSARRAIFGASELAPAVAARLGLLLQDLRSA